MKYRANFKEVALLAFAVTSVLNTNHVYAGNSLSCLTKDPTTGTVNEDHPQANDPLVCTIEDFTATVTAREAGNYQLSVTFKNRNGDVQTSQVDVRNITAGEQRFIDFSRYLVNTSGWKAVSFSVVKFH